MKNYNLKNIYQWPMMGQISLVFIIALFCLYLGYLLDLSSMQTETSSLQQQEQDLKDQLKTTVQSTSTTLSSIALLPKLKALLKEWQTRIIIPAELPGLLDEILKLGENNQIKFNTFTPGKEEKAGTYTKVPVVLNITGTFDSIAIFISQVANLPKLVVIDNMGLSTDNNQNGQLPGAPPPVTGLNADNPVIADLTLEIYKK